MKKVYDFKGLSKNKKKELVRDYIKSEWKNLLISYVFIILSSSKPFFSSKNGAIFVLVWFSLAILLSVYAYVNQRDYVYRKKRAERYSKKHKSVEVEKGFNFSPEISGWTFMAMQVAVAAIFFLIATPVASYLQFKSLEIYKKDYRDLMVGIFADTYIVAFFNIILKLLIEFICDRSNGKAPLRNRLKPQNAIGFVVASIILYRSVRYYFCKEFRGLFGVVCRRIIGAIYIIFMLYPLIKCIIQVIKNKIPRPGHICR